MAVFSSRFVALVCLGALSLLTLDVAAQDRLAEGKALFGKGEYSAAIAALEEAAKADRDGSALAALFEAQIRTGAYEAAAKTVDKLAKLKGAEQRAEVLRAELDLLRGRYAEVIKRLDPVVLANDANLRARWVLGQANAALGKDDRAHAVLDRMADLYIDGHVTTAEDLTYLAHGLWHTHHFKNASQIFGEALQADPKYLPANVGWGNLFLAKYNYRDADQSFADVLEKDPKHPLALVGMAVIDIGSDNDLIKATERIDKALATNPKLVEALEVRADIALRNEDYDGALKVLGEALAVNPRRLQSLSAVATAHFLKDEPGKFEESVKAVLAVNPHFGDVFADAAEAGERVHRYEEAIRLYNRALVLDPENSRAFVGLGIGYSRVGDDAKAHEYLDKAFDADPYNVRAYNLASVFYDSMIKQFELIDAGGMRFRFDKSEKDVLTKYIIPEMEKAKAHYDKEYAFQPAGPLQIEIFPDPSLFAIRTVGLPRMGAHGVCFGKVITARSPSEGNFNWEQVLWHEMAHVYHIQMSGSRVPRWFTEGLAVHETRRLRPAWARPMDMDLHQRLQRDALVGIDDFNSAFTQAKSLDDILVAYYQASVVVEYIDERWGFEKLRMMLDLWGKKKTTPQVFEASLGVSTAQFDKDFRGWLRGHLSRYDGLFEPDIGAYEDLARYEAAAKSAPDSAIAQAELAMALVANGKMDEAKKTLDRALELDDDQPLANFLKGQQLLHERNAEGAGEHLRRALDAGKDGIGLREALGTVAREQGDLDGAEEHFEALVKMEPAHEMGWRMLAKLRKDRGDEEGALEAAVKAAEVSQMDAGLGLEIVEAARKLHKPELVKRYALRGLEIAPFSVDVHVEAGRVFLEDGDTAKAAAELRTALGLEPEKPAAIQGLLAKVLLKTGERDKAREMAKEALSGDPAEPSAKEVMDELD